MPISVIAAVAGSFVSSALAGAVGAGVFGSILGMVAGGITSNFINAAFADKPDTQNPTAALDQEAHGRLITVRQAVSPWQWIHGENRVGGIITFLHTSSDNQYLHMVITLAGHECQTLGDIRFEDEVVPLDGSGDATGRYAGYVRIKKSKGDEADSVQPFPDLVSESDGKWVARHRQTGRSKLYVRLKWSADLFPNGIPNVTCVVKGRKVYDPRTGLTAYSDNAALCIADYFTNSAAGLACVYASEINETQLIAAANICDEDVSLAGGSPSSYENRYTCNGTFKVNAAPREIVGRLLTSIAGSARFIGGTWGIYPAAYTTPTITLTQDDLRGALRIRPRLSRRDLANGVKGVYVSPDNNYQASDFPPVTNATYLSEDQGERIWRELDLPFTNSAATAQRIAKIELERVRQQITVDWPGKLTCYRVQPGDTVMATLDRFGWSAKVFEVVSVALAHEDDGSGGIALSADLSLRETASAVYSWSSGEQTTVDAAPDTNLPNPYSVTAPTNIQLSSGTSELILAGDGTVHSRIRVTWDQPADQFVLSGGRVELQFKEFAGSPSEWEPSVFVDGAISTAHVAPVDDGSSYIVRVRFWNALSVTSAWTTSSAHTVIGKTLPPENVTGFTAQQNGNVVVFRWNQVGDTDLAGYEIRYGNASIAWADGTPLTQVTRGTQITTAAVPPGDWDLMIKARDTSGNFSLSETRYSLSVVNAFDVILESEQAPKWTGTLTNMVLHHTGVLTPDSQSLASALGWEVFDEFVPNAYTACYYEASQFDLGFDGAARIWADTASVLGPGETSGIADPQLQVDYRLAAGSYDGFEVWTIGTVTARWVKHRLYVDTTRGKPVITGFKPVADAEESVQRAEGVSIGAGGTTITFSQQYHTTPNIQITARSASGALRIATKESESASSFVARVFNSAGADVGGTVDWQSTGV